MSCFLRRIGKKLKNMSRRLFTISKKERGGECSSTATRADGLPPSPWAPLKRTTSLTNLMEPPMSPSMFSPSPSTTAQDSTAQATGIEPSSSIWRRLLCCERESYGKRAWEEVLTFNTRLINLEQHHEEMKNIFMTEVRRLKDLLEAKEEEERSLKEEMRRIISFNKTPTEAALVYNGVSPPSSSSELSTKAGEGSALQDMSSETPIEAALVSPSNLAKENS